ncbi:MAG: NAD+ synthase [Candidatus Anammoxibacter sp.]
MKIALAQINTTIGAFKGNVGKICAFIDRAKAQNCDLVVFPEMAVTGYPPRDLLDRAGFISDNIAALDIIREQTDNIAALVGFVDINTDKKGKHLYNAAAFIQDKRIQSKHYKTLLPSYDVFDEHRYFEPAQSVSIVEFRRLKFGITICEDIWNPDDVSARSIYNANPVKELLNQGAEFIINMSASPFENGKMEERRSLVTGLAVEYKVPFIYVNQVGGNDDLIFDGNSIVANADGDIVTQGAGFDEDLLFVEIKEKECEAIDGRVLPANMPNDIETIYNALVLGLRDYVRKCGFEKVVLGLSGGIDSAVVAAIACRALGSGNVVGVAMPSVYSSDESLEDAKKLAENLGINLKIIPVTKVHTAYTKTLKGEFKGLAHDTTEENLQARMRGDIVMALSNKFGYLVLTTGNKSELAVGYCTLYGDMCGGLAVISDVPKMMVYDLAAHINTETEIIPINTIEKAPTAELKPDQKDQDSLPPYPVLDGILKAYIEETKTVDEIVGMNYEEGLVREIIKKVNMNEYKRKQAAPGLRVTSKAFGTGRRIPIAQSYCED